jgi:hypothetical protein
MPIKIVLETIRGKALGEVLDPNSDLAGIWPIDDPSFPLLQFIDPYGNTIFNGRQMSQVLHELESLDSRSSREDQKAILNSVKELALHCRENPHEYLRFVGD